MYTMYLGCKSKRGRVRTTINCLKSYATIYSSQFLLKLTLKQVKFNSTLLRHILSRNLSNFSFILLRVNHSLLCPIQYIEILDEYRILNAAIQS